MNYRAKINGDELDIQAVLDDLNSHSEDDAYKELEFVEQFLLVSAIHWNAVDIKVENRELKNKLETAEKENNLIKTELNTQGTEYERKVRKLLFENCKKTKEFEKKLMQEKNEAEKKLKEKDEEILKLCEKLNETKLQQTEEFNEIPIAKSKSPRRKRKLSHETNKTKKFKCSSCCLDFYTKKKLFAHQKRHEEFATKWNNLSPSVDNWELRPFRCVVCGFSTKIKKYLDKHMENHNGENKGEFNCIQCSYSTDNKSEFLCHIKVHQKDYSELIKCQLCEFADRRSFELIEHMIGSHKLDVLRKEKS